MSDINLKCVFCGESTLQKTIKFSVETLKKCVNILEYRRSSMKLLSDFRAGRAQMHRNIISLNSASSKYHINYILSSKTS